MSPVTASVNCFSLTTEVVLVVGDFEFGAVVPTIVVSGAKTVFVCRAQPKNETPHRNKKRVFRKIACSKAKLFKTGGRAQVCPATRP
jgi:hypothetical protein